MIKHFHVRNYKALHDVALDLTPIHVLIGANDSGKTSILEVMAALCRSAEAHELVYSFPGSWEGRQLVWKGTADDPVAFEVRIEDGGERLEYQLACLFHDSGRKVEIAEECMRPSPESELVDLTGKSFTTATAVARPSGKSTKDRTARLRHSIPGVQMYRWNPDLLPLPVVHASERRFRMESSGFGLAQCLDDILGYDRDRFIDLETRCKNIFPQIDSIKLIWEKAFHVEPPAPGDPAQPGAFSKAEGKGIYFRFTGSSQLVPASQVSDGVLLVLAYLAILYSPRPLRILLLEEPENGIHPKRLQDVLAILRDLVHEQTHTQVVLTTHSPYVLDLFEPEEVTLCRRRRDGSIAVHRLSESETVREQIDVFTLGEIWTGEEEEALVPADTTGETIEP